MTTTEQEISLLGFASSAH